MQYPGAGSKDELGPMAARAYEAAKMGAHDPAIQRCVDGFVADSRPARVSARDDESRTLGDERDDRSLLMARAAAYYDRGTACSVASHRRAIQHDYGKYVPPYDARAGEYRFYAVDGVRVAIPPAADAARVVALIRQGGARAAGYVLRGDTLVPAQLSPGSQQMLANASARPGRAREGGEWA